jgi:hypothetical protein
MVLSGLLIWTKRTAQATAAALKRSERPGAGHSETPWRSSHEPGRALPASPLKQFG